jgi:hypothetical protein
LRRLFIESSRQLAKKKKQKINTGLPLFLNESFSLSLAILAIREQNVQRAVDRSVSLSPTRPAFVAAGFFVSN